MAVHAADWTGESSSSDWENESADWPTRYSQYLLRVAGQSAEMLELYQEVMDSVARKELSPTVLQDMQPAFARVRGTAYNNQFAEITMRFFTDMVQIGSTYTDELAELFLPSMEEHPLQPPPLNTTDPILWYQQLNEYATQMNARIVRTYQSLFDRVASGEVTPSQLQEVSTSYVERRYPQFLHHLSVSYFKLLDDLNDLYTGYQQEFLKGVLSTIERPDAFLLKLEAPLGETASATVSLANTTEAPTTIRCAANEIRRADGVGPSFSPQFSILPDSFNLRPGEEAILAVSLNLDADLFEVDVLYVGSLQITGHGEPRFEIPLRITAKPGQENSIPTHSE
ncbi:MAG: hypothetical protein R3293_20855 [Candidatus Promineifilaceae bacterium]|nr:hypothetical protein [Candidatus Promineifilaceae bacterium]